MLYHDVEVYPEDLARFSQPVWLNDACINLYMAWAYHELLGAPEQLLFVDPCVVSCLMLQCDTPDEIAETAQGLALERRELLFVPVSDSESFATQGSHWALLVLETPADGPASARYFDSMGRSNERHARRVLAKLWPCVRDARGLEGAAAAAPALEAADTPQQENGYDCGMYAVLVAEQLAAERVGVQPSVPAPLTAEAVAGRRAGFSV